MKYLTRSGVPAIVGGVFFAALYSALSVSETGNSSALEFVENHGLFHLMLAPVYALLILAIVQLREAVGARITRLARFAGSLAAFGLAVGVVAGAVVPVLEFGFGVETAEGAADAVIHMPEFMPMVIDSFLLGVAIAASSLRPRGYGALLAIGSIAMLVFGAAGSGSLVQVVGAVFFGLGWVAIGVSLRAPRPAIAPQPALVNQV